MPYKHLTKEDRGDIETLIKAGHNQSEIARQLGVDRSTISREIRRNGSNEETKQVIKLKLPNRPRILDEDCRSSRGTGRATDKYKAEVVYKKRLSKRRKIIASSYNRKDAARKASLRRTNANRLRIAIPPGSLVESYILHKLVEEHWSPEQISGRLNLVYGISINKDTVYSYVYSNENKKELSKYLRHHGNKYRKKHGSIKRIKQNLSSKRQSIHERPSVADARGRAGDLEGDTIVGLDTKDRILTHNDRATGECRIRLVLGYDAEKIVLETRDSIDSFECKVKSITYDRGVEFSYSDKIDSTLEDGVYFADAYTSWQRGSNENLNGLIRDFIPKRSDLKPITKEYIAGIEQKLNNRPRKRYNWLTPLEQRDAVGWSS